MRSTLSFARSNICSYAHFTRLNCQGQLRSNLDKQHRKNTIFVAVSLPIALSCLLINGSIGFFRRILSDRLNLDCLSCKQSWRERQSSYRMSVLCRYDFAH